MIKKLLKSELTDIKKGYSATDKDYCCLYCGKSCDKGEVFPIGGRFFEAEAAMSHHIQNEHGDKLTLLVSQDKKYTGLTENQRELMLLMGQGLSDNAIAAKTGVAPSTIRHQRFAFREKAKQARLYLAIFELAEAGSKQTESLGNSNLIEVHQGARMVDDRYTTTVDEEEKILQTAFESLDPLKLKVFSAKEKKKIVILRQIAAQFQKGRKYSEKEINALLKPIFEDYATIRRYLIEYGFMCRTNDCKEYWLL